MDFKSGKDNGVIPLPLKAHRRSRGVPAADVGHASEVDDLLASHRWSASRLLGIKPAKQALRSADPSHLRGLTMVRPTRA